MAVGADLVGTSLGPTHHGNRRPNDDLDHRLAIDQWVASDDRLAVNRLIISWALGDDRDAVEHGADHPAVDDLLTDRRFGPTDPADVDGGWAVRDRRPAGPLTT